MNATGVMPVIFSSSLLAVPTALSRYFPQVPPHTLPAPPPVAIRQPILPLLFSTVWSLLNQSATYFCCLCSTDAVFIISFEAPWCAVPHGLGCTY